MFSMSSAARTVYRSRVCVRCDQWLFICVTKIINLCCCCCCELRIFGRSVAAIALAKNWWFGEQYHNLNCVYISTKWYKKFERFRVVRLSAVFLLYYFFFRSAAILSALFFGGARCSSWREMNKRQPLNCQIGSLLLFLACDHATNMLTNTLHDTTRNDTIYTIWANWR